jgi:hypothetical protein
MSPKTGQNEYTGVPRVRDVLSRWQGKRFTLSICPVPDLELCH